MINSSLVMMMTNDHHDDDDDHDKVTMRMMTFFDVDDDFSPVVVGGFLLLQMSGQGLKNRRHFQSSIVNDFIVPLPFEYKIRQSFPVRLVIIPQILPIVYQFVQGTPSTSFRTDFQSIH